MHNSTQRIGYDTLRLTALLAVLLLLFNSLNLSRGRWILHPDDKNVFVFSKVLLHTGRLWYQSKYNIEFETGAFVPGLDDYAVVQANEAGVRAPYSPGIFFLVSAGHVFGYKGPFVIISLVSIMGLLFLYLAMKEIYDREVALLAVLLMGFSSAYVFWSNMLFSNVPALAFGIGGFYFVISAIKVPERPANYLMAVTFFAFSIWIRYEFIILALMCMLPVMRYFKKLCLRNVLYSFILLVALTGLVLALNYLTTGSFFGLPQKAGSTAAEYVAKYPTRFRGLRVLSNNWEMYVYGIVPLLAVLGCVGFVYALWRERSIYAVSMALIGLLVFYYYGNNSKFWGYGKEWMAASYTRYFLPLFMVLSSFAALFLKRFPGKCRWRESFCSSLVFVAIVAHVATSLYLLGSMEFGLSYTEDYMKGRRAVEEFVASLPENSVVVDLTDAWYEKMVVSRTVFLPGKLIRKEGGDKKIAEILGRLIDSGVEVYIFSNPERNVMTLEDLEGLSSDFEFCQVGHGIMINKGGRAPEIFRMSWVR